MYKLIDKKKLITIVSSGLLESLKIPDNVYYAGEDYHLSLGIASKLWISLSTRSKIWTESTNKNFLNKFFEYINVLVCELDLSYSIQTMNIESEKIKEEKIEDQESFFVSFSANNKIEYVPKNLNDQQYFYRIVIMLGIIN